MDLQCFVKCTKQEISRSKQDARAGYGRHCVLRELRFRTSGVSIPDIAKHKRFATVWLVVFCKPAFYWLPTMHAQHLFKDRVAKHRARQTLQPFKSIRVGDGHGRGIGDRALDNRPALL